MHHLFNYRYAFSLSVAAALLSACGPSQSPVGVAIDRSGNLYVANGYGASEKNVEV
jgi:DNA-binding beta-propeller fold protein YncE